MGRKFLLILSTITHIGKVPPYSEQNWLTLNSIRISFRVDLYLLISLQIIASKLHTSGRPKLEAASKLQRIPKDISLHQQRCTNLHCPKPTLYRTVTSGTRTTFTFCCSFSWKRKITETLYWATSPGHLIQVIC